MAKLAAYEVTDKEIIEEIIEDFASAVEKDGEEEWPPFYIQDIVEKSEGKEEVFSIDAYEGLKARHIAEGMDKLEVRSFEADNGDKEHDCCPIELVFHYAS